MNASAWVSLLLLGSTLTASVAQPTFSSLHVFGDSVSSTTNGPGDEYYHEGRWSNGRMWVEVLADWQDLSFDITNHNWSYWGHYSPELVAHVNSYTPPSDVSSALYVVWVANADFVWNIVNYYPYEPSNLATWTNANNQWLSNHYSVITNLYSKGVRNLVLPNAADLTKTPRFQGLSSDKKAFIRQRTVEFNHGLAVLASNAIATLPGLTVYSPDIFSMVDRIFADPESYGLYLPPSGQGAKEDLYPMVPSLMTNPGPNYVFWDNIHPTAKVQKLVAETVRERIWPMAFDSIVSNHVTNLLTLVNVPIGRVQDEDGRILGSSNLVDWAQVLTFDRTNKVMSVPVVTSGPHEFYRLYLPFNWAWP